MAALTIEERVAWVHRAATTLQADSLPLLKRETKALIAEADLLLAAIRAEDARDRIERTGIGG